MNMPMYQKLLKTAVQKTHLAVHNIGKSVAYIFHLLAILVLIFLTVFLISLTIGQFENLGSTGDLSAKINTAVLSKFGIERSTSGEDEYRKLLSALIGTVAVLVTLWFALLTYLKHKHTQTLLRRNALIQNMPVLTDGVDDLNYMYKYFRQASSVTVFAGDFSWIKDHDDLYSEVTRLANEEKISLVSSKSRRLVKSAIDDDILFNKLNKHFTYESGYNLKCSLVQNNTGSAFLYKVDNKSWGSGGKSVCIIHDKGDAAYLLESICKLCNPFVKT